MANKVKRMKHISSILLITLLCGAVWAQEPQVPQVPDSVQLLVPDSVLLPKSYAVNDSDSLVTHVWQRRFPTAFRVDPSSAYGRIYIGDTAGVFYAFDEANGRLLWRYLTMGSIVGSADAGDGRVVFASTNGALYCLSVELGKQLWRQKLPAMATGSVTVANQRVYVTCADSSLYAVDLLSGKPLWSAGQIGGLCFSRPIVYKSTVYVGADDGLFYAFDRRKGSLLWRNAPEEITPKMTDGLSLPDISAEPSEHRVLMDSTIFVTTDSGMVLALDTATSLPRWRHHIGECRLAAPCPLGAEAVVVVAEDGSITRLGLRQPILPDTVWYHRIDTLGPFGTIDTVRVRE